MIKPTIVQYVIVASNDEDDEQSMDIPVDTDQQCYVVSNRLILRVIFFYVDGRKSHFAEADRNHGSISNHLGRWLQPGCFPGVLVVPNHQNHQNHPKKRPLILGLNIVSTCIDYHIIQYIF